MRDERTHHTVLAGILLSGILVAMVMLTASNWPEVHAAEEAPPAAASGVAGPFQPGAIVRNTEAAY